MNINEKPISMPLIDFFIKKTAIKTLISENMTDLIIKDHWRSLQKKIKEEVFIEVSGMGYFKLSGNMTLRFVKKLEKIIPRAEIKATTFTIDAKRLYHEKMVETMREDLQMYKQKLAKYENRFPRATSRGLQQTSRREMDKESSLSEV